MRTLLELKKFCEGNPQFQEVWKELVVSALRLVNLEYSQACKIKSSEKLTENEKKEHQRRQENFLKEKKAFEEECKKNKIEIPEELSADSLCEIHSDY